MTRSDDDSPADASSATASRPRARRRALLAGTAGLAATGALGLAYADGGIPADAFEPPEPGADGDLTLIAHRGFAGENPENTVAAAASAAGRDVPEPRRADLVEVDVVPTADGDVVAFHDDRLAGRAGGALGLTDAEGVVWETDTGTVTDAEVLGSGETVPLLGELLAAVPADVGVNVELKNPGRADLRPGETLSGEVLAERTAAWRPFVERVCSVLDEHDNAVLLSSFCEGALAAAREASSYPVAPILSGSVEDGLAIAREHDAEAVHPPIDLVRGTPIAADGGTGGVDLVETAHAEGRAVNVWTVETWYEARWLAAVGVDGVIADYAGLLDRRP
ncbi:glycerophosphodiester phosphodiesterase [Halorubrum halodurans]|uniref:Glycerophosphodiester phosphodiesterase n=1 Tax=Halorubrum halodurans TaxID=1383851 RepID=A0A256IHZ5_9EURY|nr:glycerophosphodiester phosphodiesterase [Halorubrum halodurans]OYR56155.1 glycerophosphodiester phosphodiesterase [Halorubrum halodurans]